MTDATARTISPSDIAAFSVKLAEWVTLLSPKEQAIFESALTWVAHGGTGDVAGYAQDANAMNLLGKAFSALEHERRNQ